MTRYKSIKSRTMFNFVFFIFVFTLFQASHGNIKNSEINSDIQKIKTHNKIETIEKIILEIIKSKTDKELDVFFAKFIGSINERSKHIFKDKKNTSDDFDHFMKTWYGYYFAIVAYDNNKNVVDHHSEFNEIAYVKVMPRAPDIINFTPFLIKATEDVKYWLFINDLHPELGEQK